MNYLLAGRSLTAFPVALSLTASFMSALTVLGTPAEFYSYGNMFYYSGLCYFLVSLMIAYIFCPIIYPLKISTAYEYFTIRFGDHTVEYLTSISYLLTTIVYMGVVTYAPALALQQVTKINLWLAVCLTAIVCTIYTTLGGLKAVIWTDVFQTLVIISGFISIVTIGSYEFEGMGNILTINAMNGRNYFNDFRLDPSIRTTFWSVVLGGTFGIWGSIYMSQSMVQRYLSCKSLKTVQNACWINFFGLIVILVLAGFTGHTAYAYFQYCDPAAAKYINKIDQLIPYLSVKILDHLPGLAGLYAAGVYAGTLSTISSGINSVATVILRDFIRPSIAHDGIYKFLKGKDETVISKIIVFSTGCLMIAISYFASIMGDSVLIAGMAALGTLGGPVLGCFFLGFTCPYADTFCTIISWVVGNFCALFCFSGIFVNTRNQPVLPFEKMAQVRETCLCDKTNEELKIFGQAYDTSNLSGIQAPECLNNKQFNDIFAQETPVRGFFEYLFHISYWNLGFVGSLMAYLTGWVITACRIYLLKIDIKRAEDRTLLWFLRVKKDQVGPDGARNQTGTENQAYQF